MVGGRHEEGILARGKHLLKDLSQAVLGNGKNATTGSLSSVFIVSSARCVF